MTDFLDWDVNADAQNIRPMALNLRRRVAERVYHAPFLTPARAEGFMRSPRTTWRWRAMAKAQLFLGAEFGGTILEIGAGTAWCSSMLSKVSSVEKIYALDYDPYSVETIMPLVFENLGADVGKISRVLGSYNRLELPDATIDIIVSIGAIHHSESLHTTLGEAFRTLKPGGILVATEHCEPDSLTNRAQREMDEALVDEDRLVKLYGDADLGSLRSVDNSDHAYRLVDFLSAALSVGFDAFPYTFQQGVSGCDDMALDALDACFVERRCYDGFVKIVLPPYFAIGDAHGDPIYDPLLLILIKP